MCSRFVSSFVLPAAILVATFTTIAQAAVVQDRVAGSVSGSSRMALPGTISGHAKHSVDLGLVPNDRKLDSLSLRFNMTQAQQADLTQLLAAPTRSELAQLSPVAHLGAVRCALRPQQQRSREGFLMAHEPGI